MAKNKVHFGSKAHDMWGCRTNFVECQTERTQKKKANCAKNHAIGFSCNTMWLLKGVVCGLALSAFPVNAARLGSHRAVATSRQQESLQAEGGVSEAAHQSASAELTTNINECISVLDNGWKLVDFSKFRFAEHHDPDKDRPEESLKDITSKILTAAQAELSHTSGVHSDDESSKESSKPPTGGEGSKSSSESSGAKSETKSPESSGSGGSSSSGGSGSSGGSSELTIGSGYVVTLTNHPSRLQHAEAMIAKYPELKLSILPAVLKDSPQATTDWYPLASGIKLAEKACAQSHIAAIKKVAESEGKPTDLHFIFEDDVQLVPDFLAKFTNYYKATFGDGKQPYDIINLWRMPPRVSVATLGAHAIIPDGWWGMQGYVMTAKGAEKILGCVSKRFAQVDEMIGCCAAPTPDTATFSGGPLQKHSTRCVYNTPRPEGLSTNLQAFVIQPNLLTHLTSDFKSTAHVN